MSLLYPGIKLQGMLSIKPNGSVGLGLAPAGIVIESNQINYTDIEDGTIDPVSININPDGNGPGNAASGVLIAVSDSKVNGYFGIHSHNSGYIWTARWSAGSTMMTTPVAMYYGTAGDNTLVFYVLDPANPTLETGLAGTFYFPVTFTAGALPTGSTP